MNPYAKYLGHLAPVPVLMTTAERVRFLLERLGPDNALRAPAPRKWSVRDILCHLADTELVAGFRFRQALAEPHHVIQPYDQDRWAAVYPSFDAVAALDVFETVRKWNLTLVRSLGPADLQKQVTHPERGELTVQVMIETLAGHDLNHLMQIGTIAGVNPLSASSSK